MNIRFFVKDWFAWAPGLDSPADVKSRVSGCKNLVTKVVVDASELPAITRRRLNPTARAVFYVANQCCLDGEQIPMVFCSTYGECNRTYKILRDIANSNDISPTAFSLSVHNAISGQYSIYRGNFEQTTTIGPSADGIAPAFAEAAGLLAESTNDVLILFYDEPLLEFYAAYIYDPPFPYALALRLSNDGNGELWEMTLRPCDKPGESMYEQSEALLKFLSNDKNSMYLCNGRQRWTFNRYA